MYDLSIILLVWRDAAFLPACLQSIAAARQDLAVEIILVENGITLSNHDLAPFASSLNTPSPSIALTSSTLIRPGKSVSRFAPRTNESSVAQEARSVLGDVFIAPPSSVLVRMHNPTNRGVAPARNQGLHLARGRYILLLDADARVTQDALTQLVHFMDERPDVGLAGPRLQDAQGTLQLTCRKLPTVWSKILRRIPARWARAALDDEMLVAYDHRTPRPVDYVIGACQIIRRQAFEQVGLLDEHFFYGPEDVDYCIRMWQCGWRVMYAPGAVVIHDEQRLTKQHTFSKLSLIHVANLARYFFKYRYAFTRPVLASMRP